MLRDAQLGSFASKQKLGHCGHHFTAQVAAGVKPAATRDGGIPASHWQYFQAQGSRYANVDIAGALDFTLSYAIKFAGLDLAFDFALSNSIELAFEAL